MLSLFPRLEYADWGFFDSQSLVWREAVFAAAREAWLFCGVRVLDVDDFRQAALLYVATHVAELERLRTVGLVRYRLRSRLIDMVRRDMVLQGLCVGLEDSSVV